LAAQETISIGRTGGQVQLSWQTALQMVQPQKSTNRSFSVWSDLGPATAAGSLLDGSSGALSFYRLRYLPPTILSGPQSTTNGVGGTATFDVSVTGTAPFVYQWRRNSTNLTGQTGTSLVLSNLTVDSAGNFAVVISNRVSSITSAPVSLTITSAPPPSYRGIYTGQFAGEADAGGFAVMVRSNQTGVVVGYNTIQDEGVYQDGFVVSPAGGFNFVTTEAGQVTGTFTSGGISGQFTNSLGAPGGFSGSREPDSGIHGTDAGYYVGTYSGFLSGTARVIVVADGTLFFFTSDGTVNGEGGGFGLINAANQVSGTTVPDILTIAGTFNPTTKTVSGTYSFGGSQLGTFTVTRTEAP
jgi:hypothetical protein